MCVSPYIKNINGVLTLLPCGKCIECRKAYSREWNFRLGVELKNFPNSWYLTLTYNDGCLPTYKDCFGKRHGVVIVDEVQHFMKRLRQEINYQECRFFAVGEYGGQYNRPHYHILLFTDAFVNRHHAYTVFQKCWKFGFIYLKQAEPSKFHYLTKYVNKLDKRHHEAKPFKLMSKSLGLSYLSANMVDFLTGRLTRVVHTDDGKAIPLPRYYVKKLNERFNFHGLNFSETVALYRTVPPSADSPRWYHDYFTREYEPIRDLFIEAELNNNHITKFLDPNINMVFSWFLWCNKVTRDQIMLSDDTLYKVSIHEHSEDYEQDIGGDYLLIGNDFT